MIYFILYFLAGIIQDFLVTLNWRYVAEKKIALASVFSFLATVLSFTVIYDIISRLDSEDSLTSIIFYSLGVGLGTILGMKVKFGFNK
jgi:uncharacterized protein YebE (UPF0316 family)